MPFVRFNRTPTRAEQSAECNFVEGGVFEVSNRSLMYWLGLNAVEHIDAPVIEPDEDEVPESIAGLEIRHVGKGRYSIFRGEERLTGPLLKGAAEQEAERLAAAAAIPAQAGATTQPEPEPPAQPETPVSGEPAAAPPETDPAIDPANADKGAAGVAEGDTGDAA